MPSEFPRSPKLLKGALIKLSEEFLGPVPNIIVFQYNPETITRSLTPWQPTTSEGQGEAPSATDTAQPYDPGESFDLTLELDAADALEEPESHPVAVISGVADRIAALEMLLYPAGASLLGEAFAGLGGLFDAVPRESVPIVMLVWGPGRIVPVRLKTFKVEEEAFSPSLYPVRATVTVGLQVLTAESFEKPGKKLSVGEELAVAAYNFTRGQKEALARMNLANTAESILGLLPF
jgi:hypothetical protein